MLMPIAMTELEMKLRFLGAGFASVFVLGVGLFGLTTDAAAEAAIPNPMIQPGPLMPQPGQPMSPMNIAPMQPLGGLAGQPETGVERDPEFENLPISPGMEDTFYACTACHSSQTFQQMRLTEARWEYLWDWMIKEQGMPEYDAETRDIILAYLNEHFSSER
ncbi:MAG: hypothetical protein NXI16_05260 [Alphaproteobacteria bacterium]|nr:hypothetical protein [Alphaproteobacteria bacterium]